MTDPQVLEELGLRAGEPVRFRRTGARRWSVGKVAGVSPDGSILLHDADGAARNLRPDRRRGPPTRLTGPSLLAYGERRGRHVGATRTVVTAPHPRRLARLLLAVLAALTVAGVLQSSFAAASSKSFRLVALDTAATVREDASMEVVEQWTYRFDGGPFNFGIRSFERDNDRIQDFTASDEEGPLVVIPPDESISGDWEWELRGPTSDTTVTYTLTYRVDGAVEVGSDVGDLNWMFLGTEHPGVGQVDIAVTFPPGIPPAEPDVADDDTTVLRGFAHGPSNGVVLVDESLVTASVDDVDAGQFVEIRALAPADAFIVSGTEELLPDALEQERQIAEEGSQAQDEENRRGLIWILAPLLAFLGVGGTGAVWFSGGRERKSKEVLGEYWREPLTERPAVALDQPRPRVRPFRTGDGRDARRPRPARLSADRRGAQGTDRQGRDRPPVHLDRQAVRPGRRPVREGRARDDLPRRDGDHVRGRRRRGRGPIRRRRRRSSSRSRPG